MAGLNGHVPARKLLKVLGYEFEWPDEAPQAAEGATAEGDAAAAEEDL